MFIVRDKSLALRSVSPGRVKRNMGRVSDELLQTFTDWLKSNSPVLFSIFTSGWQCLTDIQRESLRASACAELMDKITYNMSTIWRPMSLSRCAKANIVTVKPLLQRRKRPRISIDPHSLVPGGARPSADESFLPPIADTTNAGYESDSTECEPMLPEQTVDRVTSIDVLDHMEKSALIDMLITKCNLLQAEVNLLAEKVKHLEARNISQISC